MSEVLEIDHLVVERSEHVVQVHTFDFSYPMTMREMVLTGRLGYKAILQSISFHRASFLSSRVTVSRHNVPFSPVHGNDVCRRSGVSPEFHKKEEEVSLFF